MRPRWQAEIVAVEVGPTLENPDVDDDLFGLKVRIHNNGPSALVVAKHNTLGMQSCLTGERVDISDDDPTTDTVLGENSGVLENNIVRRTTTIEPGEDRTVTYSMHLRGNPKLANAVYGRDGSYLLTQNSLVYPEGAERLSEVIDDTDELDSYFRRIDFGGESVRGPFMAKEMYFDVWLVNEDGQLSVSTDSTGCSWDDLERLTNR